MKEKFSKFKGILFEYSAFLILGTLIALVWANTDYDAYSYFVHTNLIPGFSLHGHQFNLHFMVNDIFMVFFFGIAMKEVTEAFLPGGPLSSVSKASLPIVATLGGVIGPVALFIAGAFLFKTGDAQTAMLHGWAIPTATDIAYSWLFARLIFGAVHPAVTFLLVLAVLDDLIGMMIIAIFYSSNVHFQYIGLLALGMLFAFILRKQKVKSFWPYIMLGGIPAWFGLLYTGVHSSLALVFIIPFMPGHHVKEDKLFDADEMEHGDDTLNKFEHFFKSPVDIGLLFFGLANAGVPASSAGMGTTLTISSIFFGKTFGIFLFSYIGYKFLKMSLPPHTTFKEVFVMGMVAAIGFTVAIFVTTVAFGAAPKDWSEGMVQIAKSYEKEMKMGALLSFGSGFLAIAFSKLLKIKKLTEK